MNKNTKAFSLIEMVLAMAIFSIIGVSLYNMFDVLTASQTTSMGIQKFKNNAYSILDQFEREIKKAVHGSAYTFKKGVAIDNLNPGDCPKVPNDIYFCCLKQPVDINDPLYHTGAKGDVQLIYFSKIQYDSPDVSNIEDYIKYGKNKTFFYKAFYNESVVFLDENKNLKLAKRNEKYEDSNTVFNYFDGEPGSEIGDENYGPPEILGSKVEDINYLFWDDTASKAWDDDGSGSGNPITEWDSSDNSPTKNKLPKAMKIILTMKYNPESDFLEGKATDDKKDQMFVFEKVIVFENREVL